MRLARERVLSVLALAALSGCGGGGSAVRYTLVDIGTLPRGLNAEGLAIDNDGNVVGKSDGILDADGVFREHAFLWKGGRIRDLNPSNSPRSWMVGAASNGYAVGMAETDTHVLGRAFFFDGTTVRPLPDGPYNGFNEVAAVNEAGQAVGMVPFYTGERAVIWEKGRLKDLGVLPGAAESAAYGINSSGHVVGASWYLPVYQNGQGGRSRAPDFRRAFFYSGGAMRDLGGLGADFSAARAVNDQDQVVGESGLRGGGSHACLWSGGKAIDLGTLGGPNSVATGINRQGVIVGMSDTPESVMGGRQRPFVYINGRMRDLGELMPEDSEYRLISVGGVNDRGQIVCTAERFLDYGERRRAIILNPR